MNIINKDFFKTNVTLRITALWAFSEAFMGGILHGLQIPFAGLALSFVAAVCITLIALGSTQKGEILKATLLVIVVKFILSPHAPPMAYVAVLIQGAVGELLFLNKRFFKPAAFILTLFSLLYSAFQHLLILTLLFGKQFWVAIDIFLNKITQNFSKGAIHYSLYIVLFYIGCYLVAGIAGGILNIKIIKKVQAGNGAGILLQQLDGLVINDTDAFSNSHPGKKKKSWMIIFGGLMLLLLIASYIPFFNAGFGKSKVLEIILRGVIIILVWSFLITPLLRIQMQKWITRCKEKKAGAIQQVVALLPGIKTIVAQSWTLSQQPGKWLRFKSFINNTVLLIVHHEQ